MFKLIKNADIYAPEHIGLREILISGEKIVQIAPEITGCDALPGLEVIDMGGRKVIPGLIDLHVHVTGGGGEQVFPAEQTEAMIHRLEAMPLEALQISGTDDHGGTYEITFAHTYTISGNPNPADLEQLLREHDQSMREEFESMLDEIESDRARRAYE